MIVAGWALFGLGIVHIAFGLLRFRLPLTDAWAAGFVGQFAAPEARRTAFWFLMAGPPTMAFGQLAVHAAATSDLWTLRLIGIYLLASGCIGVAAFPRSPLWLPLAMSPLFIATGNSWIG